MNRAGQRASRSRANDLVGHVPQGAEEASFGRRVHPAVAALGLRALDRHQPSAIYGPSNSLVSNASRLTPRRVTARLSERVTRPRRPA